MAVEPLTHTDVETEGFFSKFFAVASGITFSVVMLYSIYVAVGVGDLARAFMAVVIMIPCAVSYVLARYRRSQAAGYVFVAGFFLAYTAALIKTPTGIAASSGAFCALMIVAAFSLNHSFFVGLFAGSMAVVCLVYLVLLPADTEGQVTGVFVECIVLICCFIFLLVMAGHISRVRVALAERVETIEKAMPALSMSGERVTSVATAIKAIADRQREVTLRQSSAVKETSAALQLTLTASQEIARSASEVHSNASAASDNSETVAEQVAILAERTRQTTEVVEIIKDISNRSDLLALNAALEGVRAGEAGRGFTLVAGQMQRLSESVMKAVADIEGMADEVGKAIASTQKSIEHETDLANATARATSEISRATRQQQAITEQVTRAVDQFVGVTDEVEQGSEQALASADDLGDVAKGLSHILKVLAKPRSTIER